MRDDFHSQAWAENHREVSTAIHKLGRSLFVVFEKLQALQFDAPWRVRQAKRDKAACNPCI